MKKFKLNLGKKSKAVKKEKGGKTKKKKNIDKPKLIKMILLSLFSFGIVCFVLLFLFIFLVVKDSPDFIESKLYSKESTVLYDKNNNLIAKIGLEKRKNITYDQLPEVLINAIIATEDARFFQHNGVDFPRFFKASLLQALGKSEAGGASTITMQLSKKTYTDDIATGFEGIKRKFTDLYMALFKIEKVYTKEQIVEFYVNSNFLGARSHGVEQACQTYFGKSVTDINLAEASIIAGLFQAPSYYNPLKNPENTEKRRATVLNLMVRHGYITEEEKEIAASIPVTNLLKTAPSTNQEEYQDFIDTVMAEVEKVIGIDPSNVAMEIYTTMDPELQKHVNKAMDGESFKWENDFIDGGISVIETSTGAIRAIGAGRNHVATGFNTAIDTNKQIGSTAKPLYDYGPGIEYENWSTYTPWIDQPHTYSDGKTEVVNADGGYMGFMTSRSALTYSRNIPALKAFQSLNKKNVLTFSKNLGLSPENEDNSLHEAHAIGGYNGESPLSLSAAYAAFANKGVYNEPYSFTRVVIIDTKEEKVRKLNSTEVMSESTAYMINSMLSDTARYVMGSLYNINGVSYIAKTGTTNYSKEAKEKYNLPANAVNDLWLVGATSEYSVAIWYGYQRGVNEYVDNKAITIFGNMNHRSLFHNIVSGVFKKNSITRPSDVVEVQVEFGCLAACLPSKYTPGNMIRSELFKKGTEPTDVSNRYNQLKNITDLESSYKNGVVSLSWKKIDLPDALNEEYLTKYAKKYFTKNEDVNYYVRMILNENRNTFGNVEYEIYMKDENGNLAKIKTTTDDHADINIISTSKPITYVVKTTYSSFKSNASSGTETTVTFKDNEKVITAIVNGADLELHIGESFTDPGITVLDNLVDVTAQATITKTIVDSKGKTVTNIDTSKEEVYTITYQIKYNDFNKSLKRTVTIIN